MTKEERKMLAEAMVPLESLYHNMKFIPYAEISSDLQHKFCESVEVFRNYVLYQKGAENE